MRKCQRNLIKDNLLRALAAFSHLGEGNSFFDGPTQY